MKIRVLGLFLSMLLSGDGALSAPAPRPWTLGTGFDYSRGRYGLSEDTQVLSTPAIVTYETQQWTFRGSVPYVTIEGPAEVVLLPAATGAVAAPGASNSVSGLGDVAASATYRFAPVFGNLYTDLTGRLKLPTADTGRNLGTGKVDYFAQVGAYRAATYVIPFASAGYRMMGRTSRYPFKNGAFASAGLVVPFKEGHSVGLVGDWRSRLVEGGVDSIEATLFGVCRINPSWTIHGYVLMGFSDASPDLGMGASASLRL